MARKNSDIQLQYVSETLPLKAEVARGIQQRARRESPGPEEVPVDSTGTSSGLLSRAIKKGGKPASGKMHRIRVDV